MNLSIEEQMELLRKIRKELGDKMIDLGYIYFKGSVVEKDVNRALSNIIRGVIE